MPLSPSEIGAVAEREVAYALERAGWSVYLPHLASHLRIDLIALDGDGLLRVQVKTSQLQRDAVVFRTCSNTANVRRDYGGEIDAFGVYSPELDRSYLVPIEATPSRSCSLRLGPTRNGQRKGVRFAADFEIRRPG